jgi:hypothetical protein
MTEKEIKLTAQLMAIEQLLTQQIALNYASKGYTPELVKSMHKLKLDRARQETFPNVDPGLSDLAAGEYELELERLLHAIEWHLEALKSR